MGMYQKSAHLATLTYRLYLPSRSILQGSPTFLCIANISAGYIIGGSCRV